MSHVSRTRELDPFCMESGIAPSSSDAKSEYSFIDPFSPLELLIVRIGVIFKLVITSCVSGTSAAPRWDLLSSGLAALTVTSVSKEITRPLTEVERIDIPSTITAVSSSSALFFTSNPTQAVSEGDNPVVSSGMVSDSFSAVAASPSDFFALATTLEGSGRMHLDANKISRSSGFSHLISSGSRKLECPDESMKNDVVLNDPLPE